MIQSTLLVKRAPIILRHPASSVRRQATTTRRPFDSNRPQNKHATTRKESTSNNAVPGQISEPSLLLQPFAWYSRKLDTHPLATKCISSGFVSGIGDVLGQYIQHSKDPTNKKWKWDSLRTGRFAVLGFALVAPVCHVWYKSLMERIPGSSFTQISKRVVLDQFVFAPLFLPTWLLNLWMLEGKSADYVMKEMPIKFPPTVVANWALYIPAQTVNLGFVPGKYQVLFSNIVAVAWNAFLSLTTQGDDESVAKDEDEATK